MMLVGALLFGVWPVRQQLIGTLFSMCGVLMVLSRGAPAQLAQVHLVPGDVFMLAATFCWACYSWLLVRPPRWAKQPVRATVVDSQGRQRPWNWAEFLLVQLLFGLVWASGAAGGEHLVAPRPIQWQPTVLAALVFIAIGPSVVAYWFWGEGVALGGPALAAIFSNLTPLFAALLSALILGELPHWYHGVAFALIVAGIVVSSWRRPTS
jgi:drug/metabolite transporter (DMT)-like permease